jgi:predicted esterase
MTNQSFAHRYVPASDSNAPTLLLLHGTGGDEDSLLELGSALAPGAALLSPRGKVLEGSMPRFFRRKAEGVFDIEDLIFRTHELADWIDAASTEYAISPDSLIAVGYSNGANIAASLLLLRPDALKRAVLLRPMVPLQPDPTPDLTGARVLIEAGAFDTMVPLPQAERLASLLQGFGAQVTFHKQPASHGLVTADITAAQDWIKRQQTEPITDSSAQ